MAFLIGLDTSTPDEQLTPITMKCRPGPAYVCFDNLVLATYGLKKLVFLKNHHVVSVKQALVAYPDFDKKIGYVVYFTDIDQLNEYLSNTEVFDADEIIKPISFVIHPTIWQRVKSVWA